MKGQNHCETIYDQRRHFGLIIFKVKLVQRSGSQTTFSAKACRSTVRGQGSSFHDRYPNGSVFSAGCRL